MSRGLWTVAALVLVLGCAAANASIVLAGQVYDDNAFVDEIIAIHGSWTNPAAVIGPNIMSYAQNNPPDAEAYLLVGFADNSIVNGAGPDFVLHEAGGTLPGEGEPAKITVNGVTNTYPTVYSGVGGTHRAYIDLGDFGVAPGGRGAAVQLWGLYSGLSGTEFMASGALNNGEPIPAPGAMWLVGVGLCVLRGSRRLTKA